MRTVRLAFFACSLTAAACVGLNDMPTGPMDGPSQGPGRDQTPDGDGPGGSAHEPAGIGTAVFGLCEDGDEQPGPRLLRLLTRRELSSTLRDLLFIAAPDVARLPLEARVRGYDNNAAAQAVTSRHVDEYLTLAESVAAQAVQQQRGQLLRCDPNAPECAGSFVREFGLRAFRRPLSEEEVSRYQALFAADLTENDFDAGLRLVISAMLISPHFLYRSEVGEDRGDGTFALSPYELASALSYLYWGSMPDQALFDAAAQGKLGTQAELAAQAERLLSDARAKEQLGEFSLQWLRSDNLLNANKDKMIYPGFSDSLREAMLEEQRRFFTRVALEDLGSYHDLLLADYVVANPELAGFYGLSSSAGEFAMVQAPPHSGRGGLLGLGAVLAAHAHANESSPIRRGLFVRDRLLCQDLPQPPEDLDTSPPPLDPVRTTRERFERHTSDPKCQGCHKFIDGIGNGLEEFDGVGQRRDNENGLPIDRSGQLLGLEGLQSERVDSFAGPRELAQLLAESPTAQACFALQYFRYARGHEERRSDACSLQSLKQRFEQSGLTVKELLVALPQLSSFSLRSAE